MGFARAQPILRKAPVKGGPGWIEQRPPLGLALFVQDMRYDGVGRTIPGMYSEWEHPQQRGCRSRGNVVHEKAGSRATFAPARSGWGFGSNARGQSRGGKSILGESRAQGSRLQVLPRWRR